MLFYYTLRQQNLLQRRRVTKEILCQYLHNNRVPMSATDKGTLVRKALQMWDRIPRKESPPAVPETQKLGIESNEMMN